MIALLLALAPLAPPPPQFTQRLGERLPLTLAWNDESGRATTLGACLAGGKPAIVVFGYYRCAQLCSLVERTSVDALRPLAPTVGRDFSFLYLSIDPTDQPEAARGERAAAVRAYGRGDSLQGWHYLTGGPDTIRRTAAAAGFGYRLDGPSGQYAHPAGFLVITPSGRISRYFLGLDFEPGDVAAALRRAEGGRIGQPAFALLLECFRGGLGASRTERIVWTALGAAVLATVVALAGGIGWMLRQERRGGFRP